MEGESDHTFISVRIRGEEHMLTCTAFKDAIGYSEGLCNWSTLEGGGSGILRSSVVSPPPTSFCQHKHKHGVFQLRAINIECLRPGNN